MQVALDLWARQLLLSCTEGEVCQQKKIIGFQDTLILTMHHICPQKQWQESTHLFFSKTQTNPLCHYNQNRQAFQTFNSHKTQSYPTLKRPYSYHNKFAHQKPNQFPEMFSVTTLETLSETSS
jgi:hypothetical protein